MSSFTWSFSSAKLFEQCPKKYFHTRVACDVEDKPGKAAEYGLRFHEAAELFVAEGKPLDRSFTHLQPHLQTLKDLPGEKHCELKLGVKRVGDDGFEACDFDAPDRWWRGIADYVSIIDSVAISADYKTSKNTRYADMRQLDLVASGIMLRFPEVKEVRSALLFVNCNKAVRASHYRQQIPTYLTQFEETLNGIQEATDSNSWNSKAGPLCNFCPVSSCESHPDFIAPLWGKSDE